MMIQHRAALRADRATREMATRDWRWEHEIKWLIKLGFFFIAANTGKVLFQYCIALIDYFKEYHSLRMDFIAILILMLLLFYFQIHLVIWIRKVW